MSGLTLYIVVWTDRDKGNRSEVFTDSTEAHLEWSIQKFNQGNDTAQLIETELPWNELFPRFPFTTLRKDGKAAEGFFLTREDADAYCTKNYPRKGREKTREFEPLEIDVYAE